MLWLTYMQWSKLRKCNIQWRPEINSNFSLFQTRHDRLYTHGAITLHLAVVDKLKLWNRIRNTIQDDKKFLELLLVDVFGTKMLKLDSELETNKIRFIRGWFNRSFINLHLINKCFNDFILDLFSHRIGNDIARGHRFNAITESYRKRLRAKSKRCMPASTSGST